MLSVETDTGHIQFQVLIDNILFIFVTSLIKTRDRGVETFYASFRIFPLIKLRSGFQ